MDIRERLTELAKIEAAPSPVVTVYLGTRWGDEHQRDRVRVFLKNRIRAARQGAAAALLEDLRWVEEQGELLVRQARYPDAHGVALFACHALAIREILPVRVGFEEAFVVDDRPFLLPLAEALDEAPTTLVVFVDGESARLIPVRVDGAGDEVSLESDVPGHHRHGGWAALAQSRYQRHIGDHRGRHFEAVAAALARLAEANGPTCVVLAGEPRNVAALREHLSPRFQQRVAGAVTGSRHEAAAKFVERAQAFIERLESETGAAAVDRVLTEAAKGGRAAAGLQATMTAVTRGAVHRLYLVKGMNRRGAVCRACGAVEEDATVACSVCGAATSPAGIDQTIVDAVLAAGGTVEVLDDHPALARVGGVAARLRYRA